MPFKFEILKTKDMSFRYFFLGTSTLALGGSVLALYYHKKGLADHVAAAVIASGTGFSFSLLAALKLYNSRPEKIISKQEEVIKEAYSNFRRSELVRKQYPVLSDVYLEDRHNWVKDPGLALCELEKKLKVLCTWDEICSFKGKCHSKEYQQRHKLKKILLQELESLTSRYNEERNKKNTTRELHSQFFTDLITGLNTFQEKYNALNQKFKESRRAKFNPNSIKNDVPTAKELEEAFENVLRNSTNDFFDMICKFVSSNTIYNSNEEICMDDVIQYVIYHGNVNTDVYGGGREGWDRGVEIAKFQLSDWMFSNSGSTKYISDYHSFREKLIEKCGLAKKDVQLADRSEGSSDEAIENRCEQISTSTVGNLEPAVNEEIIPKEHILDNLKGDEKVEAVNETNPGTSTEKEIEDKSVESDVKQIHTSPEKEMAATDFKIEE